MSSGQKKEDSRHGIESTEVNFHKVCKCIQSNVHIMERMAPGDMHMQETASRGYPQSTNESSGQLSLGVDADGMHQWLSYIMSGVMVY